ncbi:MAG: hypothetical protein QNI91_03395 [Arenicellales bacterium]|nr:hypothetical protein [Arenicellales bacterium]
MLSIFVFTSYADDSPKIDFQPSLLRNEWYSEGWDQLFYFKDGSLLVVQISVLNIGFGSHHAGVFGLIVRPDEDKTILKQSRSNREWDFSEDHLDLKIANNELSGRYPEYRVVVRQKNGEMEIDFKAGADALSLGRTLEIGKNYQYLSFYAPFAQAGARYRLFIDGQSEDVPWQVLNDGRGFAARYVNSAGLHNLIKYSTRIAAFGDSEINPIVYLSRDDKGGRQANLALFENGQVIHQAQGFELEIESKLETADADKRGIPSKFSINLNEADYSLQGTIVVERFLTRIDPVDSLKPFVRAIVKLLNTPIQYRYLASYDLNYKTDSRDLRLQGEALLDHTVLRHEKRDTRKDSDRR